MRHTHQATTSESVEWPLPKPTQASDGPTAPSDDDLASPLHLLQVLTQAIVKLPYSNFALWSM